MLRITIAQLLKCVSFFLFFEIRNAKFLLPMNMKWVNCQQWKVICTCKCVFKLKMCLKERVSILKAWVFWKDARVHIFLGNFVVDRNVGLFSTAVAVSWRARPGLTALSLLLILALFCCSDEPQFLHVNDRSTFFSLFCFEEIIYAKILVF